MSKPEDAVPAEVLQAKRLEIVDNEGKVRAALGTDAQGVASLSLFDQSGRLRVTVDASDIPEQYNGVAVFETSGKQHVTLGASAAPEKGGGLSVHDPNGVVSASLGVQEHGQAGLGFAADQTGQAIKMGTMDDGRVYLILSKQNAPMVMVGLSEDDGNNPSSMLALTDKEGRSGVEIRGRRSGPHVTLRDRREKARASLELSAGGQPRLSVFDEEGAPVRQGNALERVVAERGPTYLVVLFASVLVAGGLGGMWIARTASTASGSLTAVLLTVVVLAAFVGFLVVAHRRGW
jgi:hypothetical protein